MNALQGQPVIYVGDTTVYLKTQMVYIIPKNPSFWPHWEAVGIYYNEDTQRPEYVKVTMWSVNDEVEVNIMNMNAQRIRRRR